MQLRRYPLHLLSLLFLTCLVINNYQVTYADVIDDLVEIERVELHCPTILYASDFGTSGTIIDQPGYYILCGDVAWTATDNMSAITTATNHVTIDLNNHAIYQTNKGSVSDVNGIIINQGIHDVTIKNGTLSDLTLYGVRGLGDNQNITIETMLIENGGFRGILFYPTFGSYGCRGLTISNCRVNGCPYQGLFLKSCSDVTLTNCSFTQVVLTLIQESSKCRVIDCHFDDNLTGAGVIDSQEILFDGCTFNKNNYGCGLDLSQAIGTCEGIIVQNCQAIGNTSDTNYAVGFWVNGPISGVIFKNCVANLNESTDIGNFGAGFWLYEAQGCRLEGCIAENNQGTESYGILIDYSSQDNLIIDCKTYNNTATTLVLGYGIKVTSTTDNTTVQDCEAFSNSGYGIYNDAATSIITGCVTGNNGTASFGGTSVAHYAKRNKLGNHFEIGEQENISLETTGINEVGCVTYLDAAAFGTIGTVIDQPGYYILCEDVNFSSAPITALSIESDFVTIDLNGKAISGSGTGFNTGISIVPEKHDITIKNGVFSFFKIYGIFVDQGCYHIDIENMNINQTDCTAAIQFDGVSDGEIRDCILRNCSITEIDSSRKVCSFNYCNDIQFINCAINKNTRDKVPGPLEVMFLDHSNKCQFINCQFNDNTVNEAVTVVLTTSSDSLLFDSCTFNNNTALSNNPLEILKGGTSGSIIRNCLFLNNSGGTYDYCIDLDITATGNIIDFCRINKNISSTAAVIGIYLQGCANKVKQTKILANNGFSCIGIDVAGDYNIIDDCYLLANDATTNATGIKIENTADKNVVKNCLVFSNKSAGINNQGNNSVIIGCAVGNNTTDYTGADALSFYRVGDTSPQPVYEYDNVTFTL